MEPFGWRTLLCFALIASRIPDAAQLVIKNLVVPTIVRSGEVDHIILDCDYDLQTTPILGLVVQWYVNENDLLYQWIHKSEPQATELVAKYIDLSYKATNDSETMYRAMKLKNPGFELSGNYTCVVSTHADEKRDVRSMLIYRTEDKFELIHKKKKSKSGEIEVVTCFAEGVYPRPTLDINVEGISRPEQKYVVREDDGRYAATVVMEVKKDLIPDPAVITCGLEIPNTGYNVSRKSVVYRGPPTTTPATTTTLQRKMDILALDNAQPDTDNGGASGTSFTPSRLLLAIVGSAVFRTFLF